MADEVPPPVRADPPPLASEFRLSLEALPPAPVFHPTPAQWSDPLAYIRYVRDAGGAAAGIAKICPPAGWEPPHIVSDDLSFRTRLQAVHSLRHRTGLAESFSAEVAEFLASREPGGAEVKKAAAAAAAADAAASAAAAAATAGAGGRGRRVSTKGKGPAAGGSGGATARRRRPAPLASPSATSSSDELDSSAEGTPASPALRRGTRMSLPRPATPPPTSVCGLPFPPQVAVAGAPGAFREVDLLRLYYAVDAAGGLLELAKHEHRWEGVIASLRLAGGGLGWQGGSGGEGVCVDAAQDTVRALMRHYSRQLAPMYMRYLSAFAANRRRKDEARAKEAAAAEAQAAAALGDASARVLGTGGSVQALAIAPTAGERVQTLTAAGAGFNTGGGAAAVSPPFPSPVKPLSPLGGAGGGGRLPSAGSSPAVAMLPLSRSALTTPVPPAKRARRASGSPSTIRLGVGSLAALRGASVGTDVERTFDGTPGSGVIHRRAAARRAEVAVAAALNSDSFLGAADCGRCGQGGETGTLLVCCKCSSYFHPRCVAADGGEVPPTPPLPLPLPGAVAPPPVARPRWTCASCDPRRGVNFGFRDGERFTVKTFREMAAAFKADMVGPGAYVPDPLVNGGGAGVPGKGVYPPVLDLESMYWALVDGADEAVYVRYGSDLDTAVVGSGFPNPCAKAGRGGAGVSDPPPGSRHEMYEASGWNLNLFPMLRGSLLDSLPSSIRGVTVPWLYIGQLFSSFCYHAEDMNMLSINYMHVGEGKVWYGCPAGDAARAFEAAMRASVPHLFSDEPGLLFSLVTMVPPTTLAAAQVPMCRTVQRPGEFIVTFPLAYHGGFSLGFNIAEAVNFATPDWLPFAKAAVDRCRGYRRPPCFSVDRLVYRAAGAVGLGGHLSPLDAGYLADYLRSVGAEEVALRVRLTGLFGQAKSASSTGGGGIGDGGRDRPVARRASAASAVGAYDQSGCGTCIECRQPAFLSAVRCRSRVGSSGNSAASVWATPTRRRMVVYCGPCAEKRSREIRQAFPRPADRRLVVSLTNEQLQQAVEVVEVVARGGVGGEGAGAAGSGTAGVRAEGAVGSRHAGGDEGGGAC